MKAITKKKYILFGSIGSISILIGIILLGIWEFGWTRVNGGISFFSNQVSYFNDGFNNSAFNSSKDYENYINNSGKYYKPENKKIGISSTSEYDLSGKKYIEEIAKIYDKGYDTVFSTGFQVASAFTGVEGKWDGLWTDKKGNIVNEYKDKRVVLLDDNKLAKKYNGRALSIKYKSEGAGYMAAYMAGAYTIINTNNFNNKNKVNITPNIVMWGGSPFDTVYDFMSGFAQGLDDFNKNEKEKFGGTEDVILWSGGKSIGDRPSLENTYYSNKPVKDKNIWYSGGFDGIPGKPNTNLAELKSNNAINNGASVIFPVAGGNTSIALDSVSQNETKKTKVIGVDSDNTINYNSKSKYILASATKSLRLSGELGMWAIDDFDANGIINANEKPENHKNDEIWDRTNKSNGEQFLKLINNGGWRESEESLQFTGSIQNSGVSITYENKNNGNGFKGINVDFLDSLDESINSTIKTKDDFVDWINSILENAKEKDDILSNLPEFIP